MYAADVTNVQPMSETCTCSISILLYTFRLGSLTNSQIICPFRNGKVMTPWSQEHVPTGSCPTDKWIHPLRPTLLHSNPFENYPYRVSLYSVECWMINIE